MRLDEVYTVIEAAEQWGLARSTVMKSCTGQNGNPPRFWPSEARQSGSTWIITKEGMERVFGENAAADDLQLPTTMADKIAIAEREGKEVKKKINPETLKKLRSGLVEAVTNQNRDGVIEASLMIADRAGCSLQHLLFVIDDYEENKPVTYAFAAALV